MDEHTQEPWYIYDDKVGDVEQGVILIGSAPASTGEDETVDVAGVFVESDSQNAARANAERIIACVNACKGVPTVELTGGRVRKLLFERLGACETGACLRSGEK